MASRNSTAVPRTMTFHVNERRRRSVRNCSRRLTRGADGSYLLGWTEVRLLKASSQLHNTFKRPKIITWGPGRLLTKAGYSGQIHEVRGIGPRQILPEAISMLNYP